MFLLLIVDDIPADREGIKSLINWKSLGVEVVGLAENGEEGYNKALQLKPDIILTDVDMPVMDGIEMTEKIKLDLPSSKFIFMSCFDDFNFIKSAMNLEAYAYVLKPINLKELTEAIRKVTRIKQDEMDNTRLKDELNQRIRDSIPYLQQQFFEEILSGAVQNKHEIFEKANYLGIQLKDKYYSVIFICIDNYFSGHSENTIEWKYLLGQGIVKYAEEILFQRETGYIIDRQHDSISLAMFFNDEDREEALSRLFGLLNDFREMLNNNFKVGITIGVGNFETDIGLLPRVYEKSEFAVKSRFFSSGNRIIMASEAGSYEEVLRYSFQDLKNEIAFIMEQGEKKDIESFVEKHYKSNRHYAGVYVKSLLFSIANVLQTILNERNESFDDVFDNGMVVWNKIYRIETIEDVRQWLVNILEFIRRHISESENNRYKRIVEDIKVIVDREYATIRNVDEIVKPLYISASHANSIFRQHMGKTIFEYLIYRRMEAAKEMLVNPYCKVYEVIEKVGYESRAYFYSIFKEYTGLTPKQYMDRYSR